MSYRHVPIHVDFHAEDTERAAASDGEYADKTNELLITIGKILCDMLAELRKRNKNDK